MCWDHNFLGYITKIHMRFWQYSIETWIHKDDRKVNISLLLKAARYQLKLSKTSTVYAYFWYKSVSSSNFISLREYLIVMWIKHYSSISNWLIVRLKEWSQKLHCPKLCSYKSRPSQVFPKVKYQSHCQVCTTQSIVVNF